MEIKRYIALIRRWLWLIILGGLLAGGVVFLISKNTVPVYRAASRYLIDEAPGSSAGSEYAQILVEQRLTQTYVEIMDTRPVYEKTVEQLNLPFSANRLAGMISISAPQDTQIIVVTVEDTDPQRAANIANTLGDVFMSLNQNRENLRYAEPIANWQSRLDEIVDEIEAIEIQINGFGTPETAEDQAALSRLETQLNEAQIRYTEAFNNRNELQVAQAKESSNILQIEPAEPATSPVRPRIVTNTTLATAVGLIVMLGIILLVDYLDDTIKSPEHILEDTALSTLGSIAYIKTSSLPDSLIAQQKPRAPISEAYRMLRTNVSFSAIDGGLDNLIISSASPGEGKSTTTANLAIVLAQTGQKVVIVDADLRRPTQHKLFECPNNQGLTTAILDSQTPVSYHIQKTKVKNLGIMTSGPIPPNPAELLNSQRMTQIIAALNQEADMVIFDSPPILTVADATILAPRVNGCLLVTEVGQTKRNTFTQAVDRLDKANAHIFGVVMNRSQPGRAGYYDYYHYYQYKPYDYRARRHTRSMPTWLPRWLSGLNRR